MSEIDLQNPDKFFMQSVDAVLEQIPGLSAIAFEQIEMLSRYHPWPIDSRVMNALKQEKERRHAE